jgi:hypothetical protein
MAGTRTVLFPSLRGGFLIDVTGFYLFPGRLEFLLLRHDCLCSRGLDLGFRVAAAHRAVVESGVRADFGNLGWDVTPNPILRSSTCVSTD